VKYSITLVLLTAGVALSGCGGQSSQDKAKSQVCDARADIQKQVGELQSLTASTATVDGVTANIKAIRSDLGKIKDAQGDLNSDRKEQVQAANQAFTQQLTSTATSIGRSISVSDAKTQVQSALGDLASSYKQTLAKIDCG
jgi:hypothetical protein